jgi:hypothetical protein
MKTLLLAVVFALSCGSVMGEATVIFIHNHPFRGPVDVSVVEVSSGDVLQVVYDIDYGDCGVVMVVPSVTILNFVLRPAGMSNVISTYTNAVLNENTVSAMMFHGVSATNNSFALNSIITTSTAGNFRPGVRNSSHTMPMISFVLRENNTVLASNVAYPDLGSGLPPNVPVGMYTLDLIPQSNPSQGVFAFNLDASGLSGVGAFIYLIGTLPALSAKMITPDGTCTTLSAAEPFVGIEEMRVELSIFPNPVDNNLTITSTRQVGQSGTIRIYDMIGNMVKSEKLSHSGNSHYTVAVDQLSAGCYQFVLSFDDHTQHVQKFIKR